VEKGKAKFIDRITGEEGDFYDKFINCLKRGVSFGLEGEIVEGDIDIKEIYERINNIKDNELNGANIEKKDDIIIINICIPIYLINIEFKGKFKLGARMLWAKVGTNSRKLVPVKIAFNNTVYMHTITFNKETTFGDSDFKGSFTMYDITFKEKADFSHLTFEKDVFSQYSLLTFEKEAFFGNSKYFGNVYISGVEFKEKAYFSETIFDNIYTKFEDTIFKEKADFSSAIFKHAEFNHTTFEKDADFNHVKFNGKVNFEKVLFNSIVEFTDILFNLLIFNGSIFNDIVLFEKKEENKDEGIATFNLVNFKEPENTIFINFPMSKTSFLLTDVKEITIIAEAERILDNYLLDFTKKEKALFDKTRELFYMGSESDEKVEFNKLIDEIKKKIDKKYVNFNDDLYGQFLEILTFGILPYLKKETVLKEYRDIRMSFENNRTYVEASDLFKKEMELIKRMTTFDERKFAEKIKEYVTILNHDLWYIYIFSPYLVLCGFCWIYLKSYPVIFLITLIYVMGAYVIRNSTINKIISKIMTRITFEVYNITSNYGESINKPIFWFILLTFIITPPFLMYSDSINLFINNLIIKYTSDRTYPVIINYASYLPNLLGSKFYIGNGKETLLNTIIYCLYSIFSLIIIGNLYIAIRRRLSRK